MLLAGNSRGLLYDKGATMLDAKTQSVMEAIPSPRIVNGHLPLDKYSRTSVARTLMARLPLLF